MIPEQIIERTLHDNVCDFGNLFHGWMCVVGNKIWKNDNGVFLFEDRTAANQAFYNSMRWKLRSIVANYNRMNNLTPDNPSYLIADRYFWERFKSEIGFQLKHI